mmetsp:Transcript_29408/g.62441  ORF Transcript_29408/g.62441 Transcript_29408/m.62441 type:complete len:493 (+) Transcript_29408:112-1590(+)|eukprot:CAMPEP_0172318872 /NCGR_PEP_ID=MMETSP1058-20130122/36077_1 /TAXON_ID=83371 /ORGANISM="Detonula confervacea, Strain CCMP 353" /LENGTH=492 /DNA_ID=CAMNT_0013033793 /DNA_START=106 /DNA_END=1584 /DNA_ORIENTATION=-
MAYTDSFFEEEEATDDYSSYWQSIPDPPTPNTTSDTAPSAVEVGEKPTATAAEGPRRRHRKRDSLAFRDVTNHKVPNGDKNDSCKSSESLTNSLEGEVDAGIDKDLGTEGSEEIVEKRRKKRKKRRSMLLPSDDANGAEHPLTCLAATSANDEDTGVSPKIDAEQSKDVADDIPVKNGNSKEVLLQLVRDYCSFPADCRVNSKESNEIESLSGYPMPGKILPVMDNSTSKKEFLLRVQPIVQEMENRKQRDVAETKLATQCEVKKNRRGGYCYYDVSSGEQIRADEYKLRYAAMIEEKRRQKRKKKDRHKECPEQESINQPNNSLDNVKVNDVQANCKSNNQERCDDSKSEQGCCDDSNMDESVNMDDSMMSPADSVATCEDKKQHVSIRTASDDLIVKPNALGDSLVSEDSSSNNINDSPTETQSEECVHAPNQHENDHGSHPLLAGMPTSNDPRVLAARRKLWCAMDAALANYSHEILAIEEAGSGDANS